jgi:hypothetical protein
VLTQRLAPIVAERQALTPKRAKPPLAIAFNLTLVGLVQRVLARWRRDEELRRREIATDVQLASVYKALHDDAARRVSDLEVQTDPHDATSE